MPNSVDPDQMVHSVPMLRVIMVKYFMTSTYQQSHGNKLHRTEQSGDASSEEVLVNMRQKESVKPNRNVHSAKPELRHHHRAVLL